MTRQEAKEILEKCIDNAGLETLERWKAEDALGLLFETSPEPLTVLTSVP